MRITRVTGTLTLAALVVGMVASAALAGQPYRETVAVGSGVTEPPGVACPVEAAPQGVRIELVQGPWVARFFENGRLLLSGTHVDRVTNVATGASAVLSLHGSFSTNGQTIRSSGRTAFVLLPGDVGPGDTRTGRFYVFTGTVRAQVDDLGMFTNVEWTGDAVDVCSLID